MKELAHNPPAVQVGVAPQTVKRPGVRWVAADRPLSARGVAGLIVVVGLACFWIAASVTPSPAGYGTHRQLGYPSCLMPLLTGYPCPTCGMTTSFAHAVRGDFLAAFHAQPAGLLLAGLVGLTMVLCGCIAFTGMTPRLHRKISPGWAAILLSLAVAFGWVYKIITFST